MLRRKSFYPIALAVLCSSITAHAQVVAPAPANPMDVPVGSAAATNNATTSVPNITTNIPTTPTTPSTTTPTIAPSTGISTGRAPTALVAPGTPELPPSLLPTSGGLTAEQAAARAARHGYGVMAAQAGVTVADAQRTEAGLQMIPSVSASARYTRLSDFPPFTIQAFNTLACLQNIGTCMTNPNQFLSSQTLQGAILNQYAVRLSLTIPLSDIPLRLYRVYEAAGFNAEARRLDLESSRLAAALEARVAFYEYLRALGQRAVAEQSLEATRRRRADVQRTVEAGIIARNELLRIEAAVADLERIVLLAQNGLRLAETVLRMRIHAPEGEALAHGEVMDRIEGPESDLNSLVDRALARRHELLSFERQLRALGANRAAVFAGFFPSVAAAGNIDVANPNTRIFPQQETFQTTWDVTLQLSWSPTAAITNTATLSRIDAQRAQLEAQRAQLREGVELEVRSQWTAARAAQAQIESARAGLASAEENYRVRRERVAAGAATNTDLAEAEAELLRARLGVVNAVVDLRIALARLRRATGEPEAGGNGS